LEPDVHDFQTGVQHSPDLDRALQDIERLQATLAAVEAERDALRVQNASLRKMVQIGNEHLERATERLAETAAQLTAVAGADPRV
jgi:septal ring factor EnvC (AmiA/AmiB activator)